MSKITDRILKEMDCVDLLQKLKLISTSDFNSLMLDIYQLQIDKLQPTDILNNYKSNRFVTPSEIDPLDYHKLEIDVLSLAKENEITPILLSPTAPLGNSSVLGSVDQKNVVSATRGTEVLSDSTNMMATILASKIKQGEINNVSGIHMCSTSRLTRAQSFSGPRFFAHFGLFSMVSSGKDTGSYQCERDLLTKQLSFYNNFFQTHYKANLSIVLRKRRGYTDMDGFFNRIHEDVKSQLPHIPITIDETDIENNYYKGVNFKIIMNIENQEIEIGDGGFVDWTQKMLVNKKERCLISAIALDRLLLITCP
jgi:hypothetical protein